MKKHYFPVSLFGLIFFITMILLFAPLPAAAQDRVPPTIVGKGTTAVPVYRFYRYDIQVHMYDTKLDSKPGFDSEGIVFYVSPVQLPYLVPLYGVSGKGDSVYTIDLGEKNYCLNTLGYKDLGVLGYVLPVDKDFSGTAPLNRWVRVHGYKAGPSMISIQDHFYQTSTAAVPGYGSEGIKCRVWTDPLKLPYKLLELSAPAMGTAFQVNDSPTISWKLWSNGGFIRILYSTDNGSSWQPIATVANTGMFAEVNNQTYNNWKIPATAVGKIKIRLDWIANPDPGSKFPWTSETSGPLTVLSPAIRILRRPS